MPKNIQSASWAAAIEFTGHTITSRTGSVRMAAPSGRCIHDSLAASAGRIVELPTRAVHMLKRREVEQPANKWLAVFTSPLGHLRDPSNTQADLRDVFDRVGYPDITSHTFRRTVATLMDQAGLTARAAADQLGHAKVSMTQDHYFGRKITHTGAAAVLESVHQVAQAATHSLTQRALCLSTR